MNSLLRNDCRHSYDLQKQWCLSILSESLPVPLAILLRLLLLFHTTSLEATIAAMTAAMMATDCL